MGGGGREWERKAVREREEGRERYAMIYIFC